MKNHKKTYESKRVRKPVSFNQETEAELLAFADSIDFSNWVKNKIRDYLKDVK